MEKIKSFIAEVKEELKKVTWSSKQDTIGTTTVVFVFVILLSIFIGFVDVALSKIIQFVIG